MGYYPFDLKILQLVAPSSVLTKAEYANVYGIDLDKVDFKSFKLIEFNGEKYAVDQIKEIEGGYEIYFNGRILSITDTIQTSDEVYDVANSKPVYCHPIVVFQTAGSVVYSIGMLIFNQSPTKIETFDALKAEFQRIRKAAGGNANIIATGKAKDDNADIVVSHIYVSSTVVSLYGLNASNSYTSVPIIDSTPTVVDGVNAIN